jgi:hypothetical protein
MPLTSLVVLILLPAFQSSEDAVTSYGDDKSNQAYHLRVFLDCNEGARLQSNSDFLGAFVRFKDAYNFLEEIHAANPYWQASLVLPKISELRRKVAALEPLATRQVLSVKSRKSLNDFPRAQIAEGTSLEKSSEYLAALYRFEIALADLEILQKKDPGSDQSMRSVEVNQCMSNIAVLEKRLTVAEANSDPDVH